MNRREEQKVEGKKEALERYFGREGVLVYQGQQTVRGERLLGIGRGIF